MQKVSNKGLNMKTPDISVQVFLSLVKWFLVILIANNLIWACVHFGYVSKSFAGTHVEMTQDGKDNNQSMING